MNRLFTSARFYFCALSAVLTLVSVQSGHGQNAPMAPNAAAEPLKLEALTVTGTRRLDRTLVESMVPVDVVSPETLQSSVSAELTDKLVQAVPSFNVQRLTIGEGAAFVRPARLRGLSPDHTLVLINGKRQHRSALITGGFSQAADLGQIPAFGLQRVEVLRDGGIDFVGGSAHSVPFAFPEWKGGKLLGALAQNMYWFLVLRKDLKARKGDINAIKGLNIGAAPLVDLGLKRLLIERLKAQETQAIASAQIDPGALERYRALQARRRTLETPPEV
jgi:hypothetical protein